MSALLESLASAFSGDAARRAMLDDALRDGLPGPRSEAWKYTSLRQLERRSFAPVSAAPAIDPESLVDIPAPRLVFVNGVHAPSLSLTDGLPDGIELRSLSAASAEGSEAARFLGRRFERGDEVFARLNAALANEGALLRVGENVRIAEPLHLVFLGTADGIDRAWHLRNFIELRAGAALTVV